jgi:hypothetical protein
MSKKHAVTADEALASYRASTAAVRQARKAYVRVHGEERAPLFEAFRKAREVEAKARAALKEAKENRAQAA